MEFECQKIEQLNEIAHQIIENTKEKRVFAFYGAMGAGKTTLIKALCNELNTVEEANSPTFAIINEYGTIDDQSVYHFDFYRIKNVAEAMDIGCDDYFYSGYYCFIEWPEKIESILPDDKVKIIIFDEKGVRRIQLIY